MKESTIKDFFLKSGKEDKFTKVVQFEGTYNFGRLLDTKSLEGALNPIKESDLKRENFPSEINFLSAKIEISQNTVRTSNFTVFNFLRKGADTQIVLKVGIIFSCIGFKENGRDSEIKKLKILSNAKVIFLLDDKDLIECDKCIQHYYDNDFLMLNEYALIEVDLPSFIRLVNASKIDVRLIGNNSIIGESELSDRDLINLKAYYNVLFDDKFEVDVLTNFVKQCEKENQESTQEIIRQRDEKKYSDKTNSENDKEYDIDLSQLSDNKSFSTEITIFVVVILILLLIWVSI